MVKSITNQFLNPETYFPEGNLQNIISTSPTQRDYNIRATEDLVENVNPFGVVGEVVAPAAAGIMSLPYDAIQAATRTTQSDIDRAMQTGALTPRDIASEAFGLAYDRENPLSSAIERAIGAAGPLSNRISNFSAPNIMGTAQAAEVTPQNEPLDIEDFLGTSTPQDLGFIDDAPQIKEAIYQDRIMNPNLPGFAFQPKESLRSIIGSQLQNVKTKAGQGFDFAKQLPGMALSAITGIPFAGQILQGIGSMFRETPEQRNFRENIATDPEYQSLVSQIPGMSNYNQIFGMGSGRGLLGAIDKRLATLARTEKRQGVNFSETLKERRKKLEALRELERQKESEFLESQRRGRRPGTGGDGGGGVRDSGGPTGGYSYDSGGRQGFGYGLRDGGLASLAHRRG